MEGKSPFVVHCKKSEFDVYIGRPSKWGNPFSHKDGTLAMFKVATREEAIAKYTEWLFGQNHLLEVLKFELRGKILGCWCSPQACHGEILAALANEEDDKSNGE